MDLLVDSTKSYRLFEDDLGQLCLGIMTGGFALYEVTFRLFGEEQAEYAKHGKAFLEELSYRASRDPGGYCAR